MDKLYRDGLRKKGFLCFLISYIGLFWFYRPIIPYDSFVMYGHYLTLVPNMAFLFFCYGRVQRMGQIYPLYNIRIPQKSAYHQIVSVALCNTLLYTILIFVLPLPFVFIYDPQRYCYFVVFATCLQLSYEVLYAYQILHHKESALLLLVIAANLIFHFGIILTVS